MSLLGAFGVILGLGALIYLNSFKHVNVLLASLAGTIVIIFFNGMPLWETITDCYASGVGSWVNDFLIIFVLGGLLAASLQRTGCAQSMGEFLIQKLGTKYVGIIIHFISFILVYAGVDTLVAVLSIAPISIAMVRKANLPRRFAAACYMAGGCSYVFAVPGSSAVNNLLPMDFLGTNTVAAWIPGLIGSAVASVLILIYQRQLEKRLRRKNIRFDLSEEYVDKNFGCREDQNLPSAWIGFASLLIVMLCSVLIGGCNLLNAKFAICIGLTAAIVITLIFGHKTIDGPVMGVIQGGVIDGIICTVLTGAMLGFVNVIQATGSFMAFANWTMSVELPPLLGIVFSILMMNIVMANSPGSLSIFMSNFSGSLIAAGIQPAMIHRVAAMSVTSFTSMMPHSPTAVGLTETYKAPYLESIVDIAVICVIAPLIGTLAAVGAIYMGLV